ncbi:MAG: hypothetical protein AB1671_08960 [Thermodesulfobacteriota bacterium]
MPLEEKAHHFERAIRAHHLSPEGILLYKRRIDRPEGAIGDAPIWTGCYVGAQALRYAVTREEEALAGAHIGLRGLHFLQAVTGKRGLLCRGVSTTGVPRDDAHPQEWHRGEGPFSSYLWHGDVSVDQYTGAMFGYAVAYDLLDDDAVKLVIAEDVTAIADHLIEHGMTIVDVDNEVTTFGHLEPSFWTEDLNALIALGLFKIAHRITGEERFARQYHTLIARDRYHERAVAARDLWWEKLFGVNHSDNNLAFLVYYPLLRYETDPELLSFYRESLRRTWRGVAREGNPFFAFVYRALTPSAPPDGRALRTLRHFPLEKRNLWVHNSTRADQCISWVRARNGRLQACAPLPVEERPPSTFEWKENPYRLDGGGDGAKLYTGTDYLLAYWLGRYCRFL